MKNCPNSGWFLVSKLACKPTNGGKVQSCEMSPLWEHPNHWLAKREQILKDDYPINWPKGSAGSLDQQVFGFNFHVFMNTFILYRNEKVWYWPGLRRAPFLHYRELSPSHKPDLDLHGLLGHKTFVENMCDTVMMFKTNLSRSCWVFAGGAPAISLIVASWRNNLGGYWLLIFLYSYSYIVASWRKSLGENWLLILFDWQSGAEQQQLREMRSAEVPGKWSF